MFTRRVSFAALGLALASGASADTLVHSGLVHSSLGQAHLSLTPDGKLAISNIGSSGQDGVSIDLSDAGGWRGGRSEIDLPGPGDSLTETVYATISGAPNQVMAVKRLENTGSDIELTVDFSGVGSPRSLVEVFDQTGLLATSFEIDNNDPLPLANVNQCPPPGQWTTICGYIGGWTCENPPQFTYVWHCRNVCTTVVVNPNTGAGYDCARLVITGLDQIDTVWATTALDVRARGVTELTIGDEGVQFEMLGPYVEALGQATLDAGSGAQAGTLLVDNLGSTGQDGVSIDLTGRNAAAASIHIEPPLPGLPGAPEIKLSASALYAGDPNHPIGELTISKLTGPGQQGVSLAADFSDIGAPPQHIQVFNNGALVLDMPGLPSAFITAERWPVIIGKLGDINGDKCFTTTFDVDTLILVNGAGAVGDTIHLLAEGTQGLGSILKRVEPRYKDIPSSRILGVAITPAPPDCNADLDGDLDVDLTDLAIQLSHYGGSGSAADGDLTGDGAIDLTDLSIMLSQFGQVCS